MSEVASWVFTLRTKNGIMELVLVVKDSGYISILIVKAVGVISALNLTAVILHGRVGGSFTHVNLSGVGI